MISERYIIPIYHEYPVKKYITLISCHNGVILILRYILYIKIRMYIYIYTTSYVSHFAWNFAVPGRPPPATTSDFTNLRARASRGGWGDVVWGGRGVWGRDVRTMILGDFTVKNVVWLNFMDLPCNIIPILSLYYPYIIPILSLYYLYFTWNIWIYQWNIDNRDFYHDSTMKLLGFEYIWSVKEVILSDLTMNKSDFTWLNHEQFRLNQDKRWCKWDIARYESQPELMILIFFVTFG